MKPFKLALTVLFFSSTVLANEVNYKCHLEVSDRGVAKQVITHHEIDPLIEKALVADLLAGIHPVYANDGRTTLPVNKVFECISRQAEFSDVIARELDKDMPF